MIPPRLTVADTKPLSLSPMTRNKSSPHIAPGRRRENSRTAAHHTKHKHPPHNIAETARQKGCSTPFQKQGEKQVKQSIATTATASVCGESLPAAPLRDRSSFGRQPAASPVQGPGIRGTCHSRFRPGNSANETARGPGNLGPCWDRRWTANLPAKLPWRLPVPALALPPEWTGQNSCDLRKSVHCRAC